MELREATTDDAETISSLILEVANNQLRSEFSDDGWQLFQKLLSLKTQVGLIKDKKYFYLVAIESNAIVGVLCIKERSHIFHFFVDSKYQGLGVGKILFNTYLDDLYNPQFNYRTEPKKFTEVTVNSSDFGLPIYQKLGFKIKNGRQMKNGVCYTPMTYAVNPSFEKT